jgi:hypothetical protein
MKVAEHISRPVLLAEPGGMGHRDLWGGLELQPGSVRCRAVGAKRRAAMAKAPQHFGGAFA